MTFDHIMSFFVVCTVSGFFLYANFSGFAHFHDYAHGQNLRRAAVEFIEQLRRIDRLSAFRRLQRTARDFFRVTVRQDIEGF